MKRKETKRKGSAIDAIDANDAKRLRLQDKENAKHSNEEVADEEVAKKLDLDVTAPETMPLSLNNTPVVE